MKHTKEPWEYIPDSRGSLPFVVTDANGEREAFCVDHSNGDQIARRIVACVNACAGVPNEVLEMDQPQFVAILKQRAELLAALEKIASPTQSDSLLWWQIEAREALEKVGD